MQRKTIIHQKFNLKEHTLRDIEVWHNNLKAVFSSDDYIVITTPTEVSVVDGDAILIFVDDYKCTAQEILNAINIATKKHKSDMGIPNER